MTSSDIAVFIDPFSTRNLQDRLFDPSEAAGLGDNAFAPFVHLRAWLQARGIEVHTADLLKSRSRSGNAVNVYLSFGMRQRYARLARRPDVLLSAFFAFECPANVPALYADLHKIDRTFRRVFSYSTEEALRPFLRGPVSLTPFMLPQSYDDVHSDIWERRDRKLLVIVNAHKQTRIKLNELYTERLRAIEFFHRYGDIDVYGRDWDGPPGRMATRMPRGVARLERRARVLWETARPATSAVRIAAREAFVAPTSDIADTLGGYTYAICFENSILQGWITEKIFCCFWAGTVPIYLGAPDIERWIPRECFIDMREFEGYDDLREFLRTRTSDEIEEYRVAARDFLRSERFRPFSKETFAELIGRLVEEDAGVSL